ncbi:MAG: serine/threonine protein kinase [Labilithrix sp.]|nr:serine/threonine protein kinase [Labilithrix sp.]
MERPVLGGRYELGPAIGSGGFGTVFRARDRRTGADVAVKLVAPGLGSEVAAQRLRREGEILCRVASRHVARVHDAGDDESGAWLVTELVDGAPLAVPTLGRPLLPHEVLRVARGVLEGLAAVHAAGIVHGDVKPSNVLVPRGDKALDGAKLVDFGLARIVPRSEVAASIGEPMTRQGSVLGTARYMAPELLSGGEPTARSDLYAAGLVLFELLDDGPLFPVGDVRAQLRARVANDPLLRERVPEPLSDVLERMLAREPAARWADAREAHDAVVDLDTAPVSVVRGEDSLPPSARTSGAPNKPASTPSAPRTATPLAPRPAAPPAARSSAPPASRSTTPPASIRPASESRPRSPSGAPLPRLTSLPSDGVVALRETLRHLDLPMLDALARRERGNHAGRIARAVALALRLELDAAALILEPLAMQSDVARAIGAAVLAPRARRVTRARVDSDREDRWIETIDVELGAMLVALATSLATADDASRDADRCARALARLDEASAKDGMPLVVDATRTTLRVAHVAARVRRGEIDRGVALDLLAPLLAGSDGRGDAPFHVVVRALASAALAGGGPRLLGELERAERVAAETGTTLLDASAATAFGVLLASESPRDERGLLALERAGTLLAHGDAPSLEHEAEQHRATGLIALGRWADAVVHLRAAREAARAERAGELEVSAASLEVFVELAVGDLHAAYDAAAVLGDSRLAAAKGRTAALAWVARALAAFSASDREGAEDALTEAEARLRECDRTGADVFVLVEILGIVFDAARGALPDPAGSAAGLERFAEEHGFEGFFWLELLRAIVARLPDAEAAAKMSDALARLDPVVGPESRLARERRTDAPPSAAL